MMRRNVNRTAIAEGVDGSALEETTPIVTDSEARLEQLRLEVQAGTYEVPTEALAKALIEDSLKGSAPKK